VTGQLGPLRRAHAYNAAIATAEDIPRLRTASFRKKGVRAASGHSDGLLLYGLNAELCSIVGLAWTQDDQNKSLLEQQNAFKEAYQSFQGAIAGLSNNNLRLSVQLPSEYVKAIEENWLLDYAHKHEANRSEDWRKDEFFIRLLALFTLFTGEPPKATDDGPCERFMKEIVAICRNFLTTEPDSSTNDYRLVNDLLGRIPSHRPFLKGWYKDKIKINPDAVAKIERQAAFYAADIVRRYQRLTASQ
jgi:hypothetical protein